MHAMDVLAEPTRRQILEELRSRSLSVNEIAERLGVHQSGASRHLALLQEAMFVDVRPAGQQRIYMLRPEGFLAVAEWTSRYKFLWEGRLDRLGHAIDQRHRTRVTKEGRQ